MKRYMMTFMAVCIASMSAFAMGYEEARREALYLTDKMAYELNLNPDQYDYAYEINLDYLLGLNRPSDISGIYYRHRCADLRDILYDWQYNLFLAADYFLRPVVWRHNCWHFPIYSHYVRDHFFYSHPRVYISYRGGHGRGHYHNGFYSGRRPQWMTGLRGPHRGKVHVAHHDGRRNPGREVRGDGYSFRLPDKGRPSKGTEQHARAERKSNRNESASVRNGGASVRNGNASVSDKNKRTSTQNTTAPRVTRTERGNRTQATVARTTSSRPSFKNSSTRTTVNRSSSSAPKARVASANVSRGSSKAASNSGKASAGRASRGGRGGR